MGGDFALAPVSVSCVRRKSELGNTIDGRHSPAPASDDGDTQNPVEMPFRALLILSAVSVVWFLRKNAEAARAETA